MKRAAFIIITITLIMIVVGLFIWFSQFGRPQQNTSPNLAFPTLVPISPVTVKAAPKSTLLIPSTAPGVVDITAPTVSQSIDAIESLSESLPYSTSFTTSTGVPVEIYIPKTNLQGRTWTLPVSINGINYHALTSADPEFSIQKQGFREAANKVFDFISSQGVNPNTLFITWGDKSYIQDAAETWLKN